MTATLTQARDEILGTFKTAWDAGAETVGKTVLYPNVGNQEPPTAEELWARVTVQHFVGAQVTLSGATGARRFRHNGLVTVQLFAPSGEGLETLDAAATIVKQAFEGVTTSPGRVLFRNVRVNEIGPDGQWFNVNVLADFEYDEVR